MFNPAELTVGQEVAIVRQSTGFLAYISATYATVTKINGYGHITLSDGQKFDKRGNEYKAQYSRKYLADASETRARIDAQEKDRADQRQVKAVIDTFEKTIYANKNGYGRIFISEQTKASLIALINQLPVTE